MNLFLRLTLLCFLFAGCSKNSSRENTSSRQLKTENRKGQSERSIISDYQPNKKEELRVSSARRSATRVKMDKKGGVYLVPIKINGVDMEFVFDTGASDIVISSVEALFLYKQGKLTSDDILGTAKYQIADGSLSEGTVINLKMVQLGNRTLNNVKASVIQNIDAPLLLGQSALSQFGKISIDYENNYIEFID